MVREMLLVYHYGSGPEATAFTAASRLPLNFFDIALGAAIGSAFIPVFNEIRSKRGDREGLVFANEFVNITALTAILVSILGMVFTPVLIRITATGLEGETYDLAVQLTRMMFPMLIFASVAFAFVGILQSYGRFNIPAAISILSNAVMILYFLFFNSHFGVTGMAYAMIAGWFLQMFVQIPVLLRSGYRFRLTLRLNIRDMKQVGILMFPILISTWVQPINMMVNQRLASYHYDGAGLLFLELANKVFIIIAGVIVLAITNIAFPSLSRYSADRDKDGFSALVRQALRMIYFFMTPITIGVCIFSHLIIELLYQRGAFEAAQTVTVSGVLTFYALGIVFYGIRELLNKVFYSTKDTKTPMRIAVIGISLNIVLSIVLGRFMAVNGLALAASVSAVLMAGMLIWSYDRKYHRLIIASEAVYFIKALIGSLLMGVAVYGIYNGISQWTGSGSLWLSLLSASLATVAGIIIYFGWARLVGMAIPHMKLHPKKASKV